MTCEALDCPRFRGWSNPSRARNFRIARWLALVWAVARDWTGMEFHGRHTSRPCAFCRVMRLRRENPASKGPRLGGVGRDRCHAGMLQFLDWNSSLEDWRPSRFGLLFVKTELAACPRRRPRLSALRYLETLAGTTKPELARRLGHNHRRPVGRHLCQPAGAGHSAVEGLAQMFHDCLSVSVGIVAGRAVKHSG